MTPVYLTSEIRRIETLAAALPERPQLMERAGRAAAEHALEIAADCGKPVLVVAGPGNNGGDAFVIARHLRESWFNVTVVYVGDEGKLSADARAALKAWREAGGSIVEAIPPQQAWGLVVDGLFGIGLQREITGHYAALIDQINRCSAPILAVDIPSGLDSDTGRVLGCAVRATRTATFIGLKPGLLTLDGPDYAGTTKLCSLELDAGALVPAQGVLAGPEALAAVLPPRVRNSHKGTYGSVGILGGAPGMVGAALLAGRAALKLGAGRVYVGCLSGDAPAADPIQPELMLRRAADLLTLGHLTCLAIGPGLSNAPAARALLQEGLTFAGPVVLDADALNLIAAEQTLQASVAARQEPTVLTPHPAEAARLLGRDIDAIQHDRLASALSIARRFRCGVVLKGAGSICAWPDETWAINGSGNPGMASAGMGDVLTGVIAALLAQGAEARIALLCGVYLHGAAADALVAAGTGPVGLTASELTDAARAIFNRRALATTA